MDVGRVRSSRPGRPAAQEEAKSLGVSILTHVARAEEFDWGDAQWDLIVLSYVGAREFTEQVTRSLKPGGMVVVEAFHRDATKSHPIGGAVVFDTNELLKVFPALRVVRYEDTTPSAISGSKRRASCGSPRSSPRYDTGGVAPDQGAGG